MTTALKQILAVAWLLVLVASSLAADADVTIKTDIAYGELPRQKLDVYVPPTTTADTPVLVFFYGGGWRGGAKSGLLAEGESFAEAGVIFVAPDYRLYPDAVFPQFVEDAALAVSFAWRELRTADGSPRPLFVGGWSAGAYNAAMVSISQSYLAADGVPAGAVTGFIGLCGPYEGGMCLGARCEDVFPEAERSRWAAADFIDKNDPPVLLVAGEKDTYVPMRHLEGLAAAAERARVDVTTSVVPGASHTAVMNTLMDANGVVRTDIATFIAVTLKR